VQFPPLYEKSGEAWSRVAGIADHCRVVERPPQCLVQPEAMGGARPSQASDRPGGYGGLEAAGDRKGIGQAPHGVITFSDPSD
jgi:hypothetical protein